jgi:hypothetical protein
MSCTGCNGNFTSAEASTPVKQSAPKPQSQGQTQTVKPNPSAGGHPPIRPTFPPLRKS